MSADVSGSPSRPSRPISPSSPLGLAKAPTASSFDATHQPRTPISPSLMSLAASRDVSPPATYPPSAAPTSQLVSSQLASDGSPAASSTMSAQPSQQTVATGANAMPTPASSVAGTIAPSGGKSQDEGGGADTVMRSDECPRSDPVEPPSTVDLREDAMSLDEKEHARTDHDRQEERALEAPGGDVGDEPMAGARPARDDAFEGRHNGAAVLQENKPDDARLLQAEATPLFLLCQSPHPVSRPHPSHDLVSLYNLQPLAATVARTDPVTGEKRAIRKTYKGKIKAFGLAGRDKEVKHPEGQPGGLLEMAFWPAEEWHVQKVAGKQFTKGLSDDTFARLERAMTMEPGPMPGFDASILGLDTPAPAPAVDAKKALQQGNSNTRQSGQTTANGTVPRPAAATAAGTPPTGDPSRPKRAGRKRRYDEHSFEGYGEGFVDDDVDMGGGDYSTSEKEDKRSTTSGGKKRRKKNSDSYGVTSPGLVERGGSYGVGMVGVGSALGAYGDR
ncbi:MAG: hypothetical protein M1832_004868 [Thelocarpon impressellum]|nr:MAG: hypothetical protein M1832_004868 [Thelocarpon impressellum]